MIKKENQSTLFRVTFCFVVFNVVADEFICVICYIKLIYILFRLLDLSNQIDFIKPLEKLKKIDVYFGFFCV